MEIVQTDRLVLRTLNSDDVEMILTLLNQPSFLENIGDKGVRNTEDALQYINNGPLAMQQALGFSLYCCQLKGSEKTIGISGLIKRDGIDHPEVGFALLSEYCGQGFGFESCEAVIGYAKKVLGLAQLQAICNPTNLASIGLLTKLGFAEKGDIVLPGDSKRIKLFEKVLAKA